MKRLPPEIAWPAFVVALLLFGVVSTFAVLYFSGSDGGPAIERDYYDRGVAWDSVASARTAFARFSWTLETSVAQGDGGTRVATLRITDAAGATVTGLRGNVSVYRPDQTTPSVEAPLPEASGGEYVVGLGQLGAGLWDLVLTGEYATEPFEHRVRTELY